MPDEPIYVTDWGNGRIVRMNDMTGAGWTSTRVNQLTNPSGISVDGAGRIFTVEAGRSRIVRMSDMTGAGWTTLGSLGHGVNQFSGANIAGGIFVEGAGRIYVADASPIIRMSDMTGAGWAAMDTPGIAVAIFVR